ncbi:hypothetical protein JCM10450v2_007596 [Rhodotorula kratochvilovae]
MRRRQRHLKSELDALKDGPHKAVIRLIRQHEKSVGTREQDLTDAVTRYNREASKSSPNDATLQKLAADKREAELHVATVKRYAPNMSAAGAVEYAQIKQELADIDEVIGRPRKNEIYASLAKSAFEPVPRRAYGVGGY